MKDSLYHDSYPGDMALRASAESDWNARLGENGKWKTVRASGATEAALSFLYSQHELSLMKHGETVRVECRAGESEPIIFEATAELVLSWRLSQHCQWCSGNGVLPGMDDAPGDSKFIFCSQCGATGKIAI